MYDGRPVANILSSTPGCLFSLHWACTFFFIKRASLRFLFFFLFLFSRHPSIPLPFSLPLPFYLVKGNWSRIGSIFSICKSNHKSRDTDIAQSMENTIIDIRFTCINSVWYISKGSSSWLCHCLYSAPTNHVSAMITPLVRKTLLGTLPSVWISWVHNQSNQVNLLCYGFITKIPDQQTSYNLPKNWIFRSVCFKNTGSYKPSALGLLDCLGKPATYSIQFSDVFISMQWLFQYLHSVFMRTL